MDAKEFVKRWKIEKEDLLKLYTSGSEETEVASIIKKSKPAEADGISPRWCSY
ncbi:hypothetical protein [Microbulbifer sp. JMSA003]|uniref:hypothetical protein n=1 Tax=Microbulbifer sp. JMSA003 TaxID=3243369 RepID=UPI004039C2E7